MTIVPGGQFNPAAAQADDLYILVQNPPGFISGVPTDVIGVVGTASWGPVNNPVKMGSPFDALQAFGAISAAALTDPYDLATDLAVAFGQASSQASLEGWGVRVSDGTDVAAAGSIAGAATSASVTATFGGTISNGDTCVLTFTSSALAGSPISLTIPVVTADTLITLAAKAVALINANSVLSAAGIFANNVGAVVSIYQPTTLSPQAVVTRTAGVTETVTLGAGAAVTAGLALTAFWTGVLANGSSGISIILQTGSAANSTTVTIAFPALGASELYPNIPNATFFAALKNAIAMGLPNQRGPSQIVRAGVVNPAVGAPTNGTYSFSGGTDGRTGVVTATLLGSDSAIPKTGLYALRGLTPAVGISWLVGSTDQALAAPLVSFGQSEGTLTQLPFPAGSTTAQALALVASIGAHDPSFFFSKDWVYFFDAINGVTRLVSPNAYLGGLIATQAPEQGIGNKPVGLCLGTERNSPLSGNRQPYSLSEVGQLTSAGVLFITNPIPAGQVWGSRHGQGTSLSLVTQGLEFWRMTSFLARSFNASMGGFVDLLQSQQPNDPFRNAVRTKLNTFLNGLKGANGTTGQIDDFTVICAFNGAPGAVPGNGINTPASIAAHYCYVLVRVRYLSVTRFFVLTLQGGTTVVTVGATPGQQSN